MSKLKLAASQHRLILMGAAGVSCVALFDFLGLIDLHNLEATITTNALVAGFVYGGGGACAMIFGDIVVKFFIRGQIVLGMKF